MSEEYARGYRDGFRDGSSPKKVCCSKCDIELEGFLVCGCPLMPVVWSGDLDTTQRSNTGESNNGS
jgi:hypothetical protein